MPEDTVGTVLKIIGIVTVGVIVLAVLALFAYGYYNSRVTQTTTLETTAQEEAALQELLKSDLVRNVDDLKNFLSSDMITMINALMQSDLLGISNDLQRVLNIVTNGSGNSAGKTINVHPDNITCVAGEKMCIVTL